MKIAIVSTYPPQRCGLAQFSRDLRAALTHVRPQWQVDIWAIDADDASYGPEVRGVIRRDHTDDYRRAARTLAIVGFDLVVIQHEYGIFGGPDGCYILDFAAELQRLGVPYVVTLHTVLANPSKGQLATLAELCSGAARVTGFTTTAQTIAVATGLAAADRFAVVPHGAPAMLRGPVPPAQPRPAVSRLLKDVRHGRVLTTFGLIGPGKGLETAIAALPAILARHSDVFYIIAGATHPHVARRDAENYRHSLEDLAERLAVADRVVFLPAFLTDAELAALLARTDLFLTPYRSREQICSGALTFALAAGVPAVSTPYQYAVDVLTPAGKPNNGVLVPFDNPDAFAHAVCDLLAHEGELASLRDNVREYGNGLLWPSVAARFAEVFGEAVLAPAAPAMRGALSNHLATLTDDIGIIQFARGTAPDPDSGYSVDDAARLAIVAVGLCALRTPPARTDAATSARWVDAALRLIEAAIAEDGMHNLMAYDGKWLDEPHFGDHVGRSCWALGMIATDPRWAAKAGVVADAVMDLASHLSSPRSLAYAALGLARLAADDPNARTALRRVADRLSAMVVRDREWHWFEPVLTYDNARLPQALLAAGSRLADPALTELGLSTLDWLLRQVGMAGAEPVLRLVGNRWRHRDGAPGGDEGHEQPLDAAAVVEALVEAHRVTGERRYAVLAQRAFMWFHGLNQAGTPVYDPATGGCRDGLSRTGTSRNQGAESTLAYYQAMLALRGAGLIRTAESPVFSAVEKGLRVGSRISR
jgi:glycosyltransferase involved in cell wall biosynthesis